MKFESAYRPGAAAWVAEEFDSDGDVGLRVVCPPSESWSTPQGVHTHVHLRRPEVVALRDHLTALLGAGPAETAADDAPTLPPVDDLPISYAAEVFQRVLAMGRA